MDLCLASHRAVFKALQAFEEGELALTALAPITLVTTEGELRFLDGVCFAAPRPAWIGAELIGWLEELDGLSGVGAWWRPGLRGVLRTKEGRLDVAAGSQDLIVAGKPAASGFATHSARFIVAHGDAAATSPAAPAPAPVKRPAAAPPPAPLPADAAPPLRERGMWRSTAVVPWNLGQGKPVTRGPREPFGPLPPVTPPPRLPSSTPDLRATPGPAAPRAAVYTPVRPGVHMPQRVPPPPRRLIPPPRREASSIDLSHVA